MSRLYDTYLVAYVIDKMTLDELEAFTSRELKISAMALRDRHNGKLLTRAEFLAEIGIKGKKPKEARFRIEITGTLLGGNKLSAIKLLRGHSTLSLKEAKDVIDACQSGKDYCLAESLPKDETEMVLRQWNEAGHSLRIRPAKTKQAVSD